MITVLLDASLRVSLVAGSIALILLVGRVHSSSVRHSAWTAVLAAMLLMPILPYCVPAIRMPHWPERNATIAGGEARGHDRIARFSVDAVKPDHPIMKGVPASFEAECAASFVFR